MDDVNFQRSGYYTEAACDPELFKALIDRRTDQADAPNADIIDRNIPIYDMERLQDRLTKAVPRRQLMSEWADILLSGAGVIVLKRAYSDTSVLDDATALYDQIIRTENETTGGGGDHFAASGANDRIWNSLEKLCHASPEVFLRYFANTAIAAASEAWLGPNYQMTAQINLVHPGGAAQQAHRDYHLGFQSAEACESYPAHVHDISPLLTLQGAIAHCNMPVDSGPTKILPFSQTYRAGYAAWRRDDFRALFEERHVQIPLSKGDALFFSPALFHAAGENRTTGVHRMANLLQVSSAFGRAMEAVDRTRMCKELYSYALQATSAGTLSTAEISAAIAATAEGYSFPTNLDRDPPKGGLAPETQQAFFHRALGEGLSPDAFADHLDQMEKARQP